MRRICISLLSAATFLNACMLQSEGDLQQALGDEVLQLPGIYTDPQGSTYTIAYLGDGIYSFVGRKGNKVDATKWKGVGEEIVADMQVVLAESLAELGFDKAQIKEAVEQMRKDHEPILANLEKELKTYGEKNRFSFKAKELGDQWYAVLVTEVFERKADGYSARPNDIALAKFDGFQIQIFKTRSCSSIPVAADSSIRINGDRITPGADAGEVFSFLSACSQHSDVEHGMTLSRAP
jgi:hypothetical protein